MLSYLLCSTALFTFFGLLHVENSPTPNSRNHWQRFVECSYSWSALMLASTIPLLWIFRLSWPLVLATPFAYLGVTTFFLNCRNFILEESLVKRADPDVSIRRASRLFILGLTAALGFSGWHFWPKASPHSHPVLQRAEARAFRIEDARNGMQLTLVSMHDSLTKFQAPVSDHQYSLTEIRAMALELIELADKLIEQYDELLAFQEELRSAPDATRLFRNAAGVWRQFAAEERTAGISEIAQRYMEVAQLWDAYADAIEADEDEPLDMQELDAVIFFITRGRLMLARLAANTPAASAAELLDRKAQLQANILLFVQRFDELRTAIRGLTRQVQQDADAVKPPAGSQDAAPVDPDANGRVTRAATRIPCCPSSIQWQGGHDRLCGSLLRPLNVQQALPAAYSSRLACRSPLSVVRLLDRTSECVCGHTREAAS